MKFFASAIALSVVIGQVAAICPGFNYGVGHQQNLGNGVSRWTVYDDSCNAVDGLTTNGNPCTSGTFGCSAPPVIFNQYTNSHTHARYTCRTDPKSGSCGSDGISVCCRNDGN
ncbi:hypothetical protein PHLGIDRAFT_444461 [Phlebiopsis gigantea 11061_1 CR5-6]|uniref:Hydrophobin n=1 Tax=Phlebiopsis gigantea (strain 11061_1 CR5-6) TaxID=745531 RepID=A0A0C3S7M2_PHLG1|nr:hypothetical protein PHLGIDRAFT_444461 [Phlebiopsis gigantea 11061_1 CR5-6]